MRRALLLALVAAAPLAALPGPALAQAKIRAGTLTCHGGAGIGLVLGSKKTYACTYTSASGRHVDDYSASVTRIGIDIGVTGESVIVWTVLASADALEPRALAGNYAGATADASIGVGGGAKVLVGGSNNAIVLQPLSVQGQTGLNLAVGVAEMSLR